MLAIRPRRNRKSPAVRALVQETRLQATDLIHPQFVIHGEERQRAVASLPGVSRLSVDLLIREAERVVRCGIPAIALFPVIPPELKDERGTEASNPEGLLPTAVRALKEEFPQLCVITDIALDPYTTHGHDGLVNDEGVILNDATIERLVEMALVHAEAGADMVAPSDMMDGRVGAIRRAFDGAGWTHVSILAYTVKYASALYGPFREAVGSSLAFGDKKTYQMNPANSREALIEAALDGSEGADILMIKPATFYLDVIAKLRTATYLPLAAYHVSGEYAMLKAAEKEGWLDGKQALYEALLSIKRAGADMIFSYGALEIASLLTSGALH